MIRKFLAILINSCLVSCVAMTPIPVAGDLEMDFPIEDPDNLSEGTIERHSIEMSVGASMDIDESFTTGLTFGIRGSRYYEAQFSDSNEIWFSENKTGSHRARIGTAHLPGMFFFSPPCLELPETPIYHKSLVPLVLSKPFTYLSNIKSHFHLVKKRPLNE